jgi:hypothetical protein
MSATTQITDVVFCGSCDTTTNERNKLLLEVSKGSLGWYGGYSLQYLITPPLELDRMPIGIAMQVQACKDQEQRRSAFCNSRIAIYAPKDGLSAEDIDATVFEATESGALLLSLPDARLESLFRPGVEIVICKDAQEMIERIRWFLDHPAERTTIATAGQLKAKALRQTN